MSWRSFWNSDASLFANARHQRLHFEVLARNLTPLITGDHATVLDYGCGEAAAASDIATHCSKLYLYDISPRVREGLHRAFAPNPRIIILTDETLASLPDKSLDLIVVNSLLQYVTQTEFEALAAFWRSKLKDEGKLVLADVVPQGRSVIADVKATLAFARKGGFLWAAVLGLVRTSVSDYARLRRSVGLTRYSTEELSAILARQALACERSARNLDHNQRRMTFIASKKENTRAPAP